MNLHDFTLNTLAGEPRSLTAYAGKTLLLVNVASRCGLTPQYGKLVELRAAQADQGFEVLGFPCNQFGSQEPGTPEQIQTFCSTTYGVDFPLFEKIDVNGPHRSPLYAWLTAQPTRPDGPGDIAWNFAKFVVDGRGDVVARFRPTTAPDAPEVLAAIEHAQTRG